MRSDIVLDLVAQSPQQWDSTYGETLNHTLPLAEPGENEGFFHYASLTAALNILDIKEAKDDTLDKDHITLWASHFLFLNDKQELFDGLNIVCDCLEKRKKEIEEDYLSVFNDLIHGQLTDTPNHFVLCFCSDGNLKEQWQLYGKASGVAIEFDLNNCRYNGTSLPRPQKENPILESDPVRPRKVIYDKKEKEACIDAIITKQLESTNKNSIPILVRQVLAAASFMKHPCFLQEKETRLLFAPTYYITEQSMEYALKKLIKYREQDSVVKPYMEIHLTHNTGDIRKLIKSITVGPGENQELVLSAVIKLMQTRFSEKICATPEWRPCENRDYVYTTVGGIEVRRSTLPLRIQGQ